MKLLNDRNNVWQSLLVLGGWKSLGANNSVNLLLSFELYLGMHGESDV